MSDDFRERALELRGFIGGYLAANGTGPAPHTKMTLEFLDEFLAAEPAGRVGGISVLAATPDLGSALSNLAADTGKSIEPEPPEETVEDSENEGPPGTAEPSESAPEAADSETPQPELKQSKGWTPERRAAAADRLRARRESGQLVGRKSKKAADDQAASTPPHRLTVAHPGYAGKREDGQLRDEDWPDIKARIDRGDTRRAIASDYDAELEDLGFFISSNERREAKQPPGESRAPL